MDRTEFILVTSVMLFVAFALGWVACWLVQRLGRTTTADMGELDRMAHALHEAEEARDQAVGYLNQREAELTNQLNQTEAELNAAMDGLQHARQEAEELRAYIERINAR
ncbi:hypothetical protein DSD19_19315 [Rhodovulum sp. BSW8]|uniref:Uncharacterized protein n=3 Tax=Rhodovulum TaxID=34008 RepID=A0A4R8FSR4_9RHOB|nr:MULTISPECIES: hypothetical protein [Rhodovulum]OLS45921.1 hypothetical protein BV509_17200 [Rhodovulum sulfidophilum]MBL3569460.1 hypothetical protein [Rhodovulum visakhapatnamense]MBL3580022.1 hypothetical protein [Rhodovulum visakhapatnamense]PTW51278.1 hypothetical protein C8N38_10269 [Rhodovulum kholense]RAP40977.1 hypothetical protein BYZ73_12320 [Rhodovulum viride]